MAPVHKTLERDATAHDFFRIHAPKRVGVCIRQNKNGVVHLVHQPFQIFVGKVVHLVIFRMLIEIPGKTFATSAVSLFRIGRIIRQDMSAGINNGITYGKIKSAGGFGT